ncbi:MAG: transposase [Fidelibacterota bacterium]
MDTLPVSANSIGNYFGVNGSQLQQQYKHHLSDFKDWKQKAHAEDYILFAENLGSHVCIDESALSKGELYTSVTNASAGCQKGSLIAMVKGTKSEDITNILLKIPKEQRKKVEVVTTDLAPNMKKVARDAFPNALLVSDRFHVQQLLSDAVQEMRIKLRWEAIDQENKAIKRAKRKGSKYQPKTYKNGDTPKQLLARSRYLLYKPSNKWTESQKARADILFEQHPDLQIAYKLSMQFRSIYEHSTTIETANLKLQEWYEKVEDSEFESFITAQHSVQVHQDTILAYFIKKKTNALAEAFNSKIKAFRAVFRGVRDLPFFLYRVSLIFG